MVLQVELARLLSDMHDIAPHYVYTCRVRWFWSWLLAWNLLWRIDRWLLARDHSLYRLIRRWLHSMCLAILLLFLVGLIDDHTLRLIQRSILIAGDFLSSWNTVRHISCRCPCSLQFLTSLGPLLDWCIWDDSSWVGHSEVDVATCLSTFALSSLFLVLLAYFVLFRFQNFWATMSIQFL